MFEIQVQFLKLFIIKAFDINISYFAYKFIFLKNFKYIFYFLSCKYNSNAVKNVLLYG